MPMRADFLRAKMNFNYRNYSNFLQGRIGGGGYFLNINISYFVKLFLTSQQQTGLLHIVSCKKIIFYIENLGKVLDIVVGRGGGVIHFLSPPWFGKTLRPLFPSQR